MLLKLFISSILFSLTIHCQETNADTYVVGSENSDFNSIKEAVMKADTGDTIFISPGIYIESNILIDKDLNIRGDDKHTTYLKASELSISSIGRIFTIEEGANVKITHITLANGSSKNHGGAILNKGGLILGYVTIKDCYAEAPGGGIAVLNGYCEMKNTEIKDNISKSEGGGIYLNNSNMNISGSTIIHNQSNYWGGGIKSDNAALNIERTIIIENIAQKGGGVFIHLTGASLYDVDFKDNRSDNDQGNGLYVFTMEEDLSIFLNSCRFKGKNQEGLIMQEAFNSNNNIFMEKGMIDYHGITQKERSNGVCNLFYNGKDIFENGLNAEQKKN